MQSFKKNRLPSMAAWFIYLRKGGGDEKDILDNLILYFAMALCVYAIDGSDFDTDIDGNIDAGI
jgi:hypothetical protein